MAKRKRNGRRLSSQAGRVQTLQARRDQLSRAQRTMEGEQAAEMERLGLKIDTEAATRDGMDDYFEERFKQAVAADAMDGRLPDFTAREAEQARAAHEESTRSDPLNLPTSMPRWSWGTRHFEDRVGPPVTPDELDKRLIDRATGSDGADLTRPERHRVSDLLWGAKPASEDMVDKIEKAVEGFPKQHIVSQSPTYQDFRAVMEEAISRIERDLADEPDGPERAAKVTGLITTTLNPYAELLTAELEAATRRVAMTVHKAEDDDDVDDEGILISGPDDEFRADSGNMVLGYLGSEAKERFDRALAAGEVTQEGMRRVRGEAMRILRDAFGEATKVRDEAAEKLRRLRDQISEIEGELVKEFDVIRDFRRDEAAVLRALAVYRAAVAARREGVA